MIKESRQIADTPLSAAPTNAEVSPRALPDLDEEESPALEDFGSYFNFGKPGSVSQTLMDRLLTMGPDAMRETLLRIYDQVAAPLHLRALLPALIDEIERRRCAGVPWNEVTDAMKLEVPLEGYAITVIDANAYTDVLLEAGHDDKVQIGGDIIAAFSRIAERTKAVLLEPVVGDLARFLTFNADQQRQLEEELDRMKIAMRSEKLAGRKYENERDKYPQDSPDSLERHLTFSRGIVPAEGGVKVMGYGGPGNKRGGVIVIGEAAVFAKDLQEKAEPGQTLRASSLGQSSEIPEWTASRPTPRTNAVLMKTIEAILNMSSYSDGTLSELLDGHATELRTSKLSPFYVVLNLEGGKSERFWDQLIKEGTGSDDIVVFKPVGAREVHLWSKDSSNQDAPEKFLDPFKAFLGQIVKMAKTAGSTAKLSLGHESALEILRLPGSFQVDVTGAVVVGTVRGISSMKGRSGNWLMVNESACQALGLRGVEMITHYVKGKPYQGVLVELNEEGQMTLPEPLLGRDSHLKKAYDFVDALGRNGVALRFHRPTDAREGGYGVSALLRATERYARESKSFTDDQIIHLGAGANLFMELEGKLGHKIEAIIENPELVRLPRLLLWDPTSVSADDAAQVNRFLFAMIGAPIALAHSENYQFLPGAMTGDVYRVRELVGEVEVNALSKEEALELVFQTRNDLQEADRKRVEQLLDEWGAAFSPRSVLHIFAPAIVKSNAQLILDRTILNEIWPGELAQVLNEAKLDEAQRMGFGILAEIGFPVCVEHLSALNLDLDWVNILNFLVHKGLVVSDDSRPSRFSIKNREHRGARLLARQHAALIRAKVMENGFYRTGSSIEEGRSEIELEHALGSLENCSNPSTFQLVLDLGSYYLRTKKDFGAAYGVYHRFLESCAAHEIDLSTLPVALVHDLVWVLTQTAHSADTVQAQVLFSNHGENMSPELFWRKEGLMPNLLATENLPTVTAENSFYRLISELLSHAQKLVGPELEVYQTLERAIRLFVSFDEAGKKVDTLYPGEKLLALGFRAAALSRLAYVSRLFSILQKKLSKESPDQNGLIAQVAEAVSISEIQSNRRLISLGTELSSIESGPGLNQELEAEISRFLLDAYKYLAPRPNEKSLGGITRYYEHAEASYAGLDRPVLSASLNAFDVYSNALALYWEGSLPLPNVFTHESESMATGQDYATVWVQLDGHELELRDKLKQAVGNSLQSLRLRLTLQLMNFIQLKMRLLMRVAPSNHLSTFNDLESEYKRLQADAARLKLALEKKVLPNYYESEVRPIADAIRA